MNAIGEAKTTETGGGEDQAVVLPCIELLETGDHIAANIFEDQVWVVMP